MRKTFVVGKLTGQRTEILLVHEKAPPPARGRLLQAMVRSMSQTNAPPSPLPCSPTVH